MSTEGEKEKEMRAKRQNHDGSATLHSDNLSHSPKLWGVWKNEKIFFLGVMVLFIGGPAPLGGCD
jgi:hypothetical protein